MGGDQRQNRYFYKKMAIKKRNDQSLIEKARF